MKTLIKNKFKYKPILFNFQRRNILIYGDLNERRRALQADIPISDVEYYNIMKEFLNEAEGVPYGSHKYFHLRNKYYKKVSEVVRNQMISNSQLRQSGGNEEFFLKFYFIIVPEKIECFKLLAILNYNKMMYKVFEDCPKSKIITRNFLGYEFRKTSKNTELPFMQMECSENFPHKEEGYEKIFNFMLENNFIKDHRTFSVYEKDGLTLVNKFEEFFNLLFLKPSNKFSFYFRHVNFSECFYGEDPRGRHNVFTLRLKNKFLRAIRLCFYDLIEYYKKFPFFNQKAFFKTLENDYKILTNEWVERINKQSFHGGDFPDDADFSLISLLIKFKQAHHIGMLILNNNNDKFKAWEDKMLFLVSRDKFYDTKNFTYVYNPFISKQIIENLELKSKTIKKEKDKNIEGSGVFTSNYRKKLNI